MPVEERQRIALHHRVTAAWGEEAADTLFELIAPAGHELATREDLRRGFERVDHRFDAMEERFDHRFAALEERVDHRFAALEERIDHRFTALDARFAALGEHFERRIADAVTTQTRTLVFSQLAALVAIAALAFGLR